MGESDKLKDEDLTGVIIVWIILNSILVLYAFILFCYAKYFKHKDPLSYVIHNLFFNIIYLFHLEKYY